MKKALAIIVALILMSVSLTACSNPGAAKAEPGVTDGYFNVTMDALYKTILASDPEAGKTFPALSKIGKEDTKNNLQSWASKGENDVDISFDTNIKTSKVRRAKIAIYDYAEDSPAIALLEEYTKAAALVFHGSDAEKDIEEKVLAPLDIMNGEGDSRIATLDGVQYTYSPDPGRALTYVWIEPVESIA